jgi:hypothetical protein
MPFEGNFLSARIASGFVNIPIPTTAHQARRSIGGLPDSPGDGASTVKPTFDRCVECTRPRDTRPFICEFSGPGFSAFRLLSRKCEASRLAWLLSLESLPVLA